MTAAIACFGAAHIDYKAHADAPVQLGTSNPVTMRRSLGGVARNVAEGLARLGCTVALVSRLGRDAEGDLVAAAMTRLGVNMAAVGRTATRRTAGYTALLDGQGELVVAMADMAIYQEMTPELVAPLLSGLAAHPIWFLDANFPAETLHFILRNKPSGIAVAVDGVSVPKARKLVDVLDRIDLLFANRDEAALLSGVEIRAPLDICVAAHRLRGSGVGAVAISLGPDGGFLAGDRIDDFYPAMAAAVRDVTGAGDALVAGLLYGRATGRPIGEAMRLGLAAAALTVESAETVNPALTADALLTRAGLQG